MNSLNETAEHLSEVSVQVHQGLLQAVDWPEALRPDDWTMSPELSSLYGTRYYDAAMEQGLPRYLLLEAVNFFSLNINGERHLIAGIADRLHRGQPLAVNRYLHHFLDEENKHMAYFAEFCKRYAGFVYPDRSVSFPRDYAPGEEDVLFFAKALIFEELVDAYNAHMANDDRLCAVARRINELHHLDESRHRAFGRRLLAQLFEQYAPQWSEDTLEGVRQYLASYLRETWKSFYNPEVYRAIGLVEPLAVRDAVYASEYARDHRRRISAGCVTFLRKHNILTEVPEL